MPLALILASSRPLIVHFNPINLKKKFKKGALAYIMALFIAPVIPAFSQQDEILGILKEEFKRETDELNKLETPPYYIDFRLNEIQTVNIKSSFGSLINSNIDQMRYFMSKVRVGDYTMDNTHSMESYNQFGDESAFMNRSAAIALPDDNEPDALKYAIWRSTNSQYQMALKGFQSVKKTVATSAKTDAKAPDFSKEAPQTYFEAPSANLKSTFDKTTWEEKIMDYSQPFMRNSDIVSAEAELRVGTERKYLLSSEGSEIVHNNHSAFLFINAAVRANDGDVVYLFKSYFAFNVEGLPSSETILADVEQMISKLDELKTAPLAEPYTGPAILHPMSAGVFFHEIFGHRVEGHRLKSESDGQTFKGRIKEQVLPKTIDVVFDPTVKNYEGQDLNGHYLFDDEGVKAQKVNLVEKGILKTFLMSRSPLENIAQSNGHGRAEAGAEAVSRQSNMFINSSKSFSIEDLRKMLIKECKKQDKEYGYMFKDVTGGYTMTDRYRPNAFNIMPTEVYRVYVDGRPDQLVRGVDLIGTPLAMFAEIEATGKDKEIFTGFCGAESGYVPVSTVAPALFVRRVETQKKPKADTETPLLTRPNSPK